MKKIGVYVLLAVLLISFISAENGDGPPVPEVDPVVKGIVDGTHDVAPLTPEGDIDYAKLNATKSLAEVRIAAINSWLDENVAWLKFIFRMKPEISWLFFYNLSLMFIFLVLIVLNAHLIAGLLGFWSFNKTKYQLIGLLIYIVLLFTSIFLNVAKLFEKISLWMGQLLGRYGELWARLISISLIIVLIVFNNYLVKWMREQKKKSDEKLKELNIQILKKTVEPLQK